MSVLRPARRVEIHIVIINLALEVAKFPSHLDTSPLLNMHVMNTVNEIQGAKVKLVSKVHVICRDLEHYSHTLHK